MASESIVKIENSSLEVKEIKGNGNDVSYIKLVFNFFADLPQKIKDILRKGLPEVMRKSLVAETPDDSTTLTVEGDADGLALYEHLEELAKDLEENEKKKMIHIFCLSHKVEPRPTDLQQLFESMVHVGKLRFQDFIYLQCLLWKVGRRDLFKKMAEKAQALQTLHQNDKPPLRISHLDAPNLEPVNGYSYVKFHLQVDILKIDSERLRNLQMKLAKFLNVPQEFIAVVGVELGKSAWVTVIMPTIATEALKRHFDDGGLQNFLLSLGIDKVGFFPEPLEGLTDIKSKSLTPPAPEDTETLPVEGDADDLPLYEHLEELEKDLKENEMKNMIDIFCSFYEVEPRPTDLQQLFESMIHMGMLSLRNFTFLQSLLWKVGRKDLFKKMAEKARAPRTLHQNDKPPLRIAHLNAPYLQPVLGSSCVKFHLQVNTLHSEQLRNLRVKLAEILSVPQEYIVVVGVEPTK